MSIFKPIRRDGDIGNSLQDRLTYITRVNATRPDFMYGVGVSEWEAYRQMMFVKETYRQTYGKAYHHFVINPDESDYNNLSDEKLFGLGMKIADFISTFHGHFQVVMSVHFDTAHHLHFIVNNIDYMNGVRFNPSPIEGLELISEINKILEEAGVSPVPIS